MAITLDEINAAELGPFVAALGGIVEHAPWVAQQVYARRPFATVSEVFDNMMRVVADAGEADQLALIRAHPELACKAADDGAMTEESRREQGGLGLDRLSHDEFSRFQRLNSAYRRRFGFPFVICVRRHTRSSLLDHFERRLANGLATERALALREIGYIARLRLADALDGPGKPDIYGRLTTHVLDTAAGAPASDVKIVLKEIGGNADVVLKQVVTNADGRTDEPLLSGAPLRIGHYQLEFDVGSYFSAREAAAQPPFLGVVPLRFAIAEPESHYHVPLLASPWSYTTYRGS